MKLLVIGGTGLIGGHAALRFSEFGYDVTIAARKSPPKSSALSKLKFIQGDYCRRDFSLGQLNHFDAILFAAGNDIRHKDGSEDEKEFFERTNVIGVPAFIKQARTAGVKRVVLIGSFYPQVAPHIVEQSPYVRSRKLAECGAHALNTPDFEVISVNPPFVLGHLDGLSSTHLEICARYAMGLIPGMPIFAIPGGTNFMTVDALSDALIGAMDRGDPGKSYLVGGENLTFQDFFRIFFEAVDNPGDVPVIDREHPLFPDSMLYAGRGTSLYFAPDPLEAMLLGYRQGDIPGVIAGIVDQYRMTRSALSA